MSRPALKGRIETLDALRGLAVLLVLFRHAQAPGEQVVEVLAAPMRVLHRAGWIGVDIFFVLSGFLVSGLLFNEYKVHGRIRAGRFLIRRGLKIYPSFYVMLAATVAVWVLQGGGLGGDFWTWFFAEALYVQNYVPGQWNHTWSLAVEEHFYFLLTALLWWSAPRSNRERPFRWLLPGVLLVSVGALMLRMWLAANRPFAFVTHVFPTHLRIDALGLGVALAYLHHFHNQATHSFSKRWRWPLAALFVATVIPPFLLPLETSDFVVGPGFLLISLGTMALVAAVVCGSTAAVPRAPTGLRWMARMGVYSYSIYLWHMPVRWWGADRIRSSVLVPALGDGTVTHLVDFTIYAAASVALGVLIARLIEFPVLRLRDKRFPTRARGGSVALGETPQSNRS